MDKLVCRSFFVMASLALGLVVQPAQAQNRFMDEARENAARRAENAAVREAEHPETTHAATAKAPEAQKQARSQPTPSPERQGAAQTQAPAAPAR